MNTTKALICILTAGAALGAAAPVFADSEHDRGYGHERGRYMQYDRHDHRSYYRDYYRPGVIVARRPYVVEQPAYYPGPAYYPAPAYYSAPVSDVAVGAIIGAAIGGIIASHY